LRTNIFQFIQGDDLYLFNSLIGYNGYWRTIIFGKGEVLDGIFYPIKEGDVLAIPEG
jgi:hypothetical protein